jgi:hypothetical protein
MSIILIFWIGGSFTDNAYIPHAMAHTNLVLGGFYAINVALIPLRHLALTIKNKKSESHFSIHPKLL